MKHLQIPTYMKYILSYVLIVTVLILGFYLILRKQLMEEYFIQRTDSAEMQLESIAEQLNNDLVFLSQVDYELKRNNTLLKRRYKMKLTKQEMMDIGMELKKYQVSSKLIENIVYISRVSDILFSTYLPVAWQEGTFLIRDALGNSIVFDPTPYLNVSSGQLIFISNDKQEYLIYFPASSADAKYLFFYILDTKVIQLQLKSLVSEETIAAALVNEKEQIVTGINTFNLMEYLDLEPCRREEYSESGGSLYIQTEIVNGYSLVSLLSNDFILDQINAAFTNSWLALIALSLIGFLLVFFSMRITYFPLRRLTQKIVPDPENKFLHLEQLERAFSEVEDQNLLMKKKMDNYRASMQRYVLDSLVVSLQGRESAEVSELDPFFEQDSDKSIFVIFLSSLSQELSDGCLLECFTEKIPYDTTCIFLEKGIKNAVVLLACTNPEINKTEVLTSVLNSFYEQYGWISAISNSSNSPLDIPSLYENAKHASGYWSKKPVVDYRLLSSSPNLTYEYPHSELDELTEALAEYNFVKVRDVIDKLLQMVDECFKAEERLSSFFAPCILIDTLMDLVNCMNQSYIDFQTYSELYYETIYFCRSCLYSKKTDEAAINIRKLVDFYERAVTEKLVHSAPFKKMVEECYCQPEFSIMALAEKCNVSISHMSYLFKKELNMNLADYVWLLRLKKSKELLRTTDMPIDSIAEAVGYCSASGFRRKFKQETGLTPSQFREMEETETERE